LGRKGLTLLPSLDAISPSGSVHDELELELEIMQILKNLCLHCDIDALLFYIYDAGYVIANSIARQPFGLGKTDRGQS
jgi:hypothetical protein